MKDIPEIHFNIEKENQVNGFELIVLEKLISDLKNSSVKNAFRPHRLGFFNILIITEGEVNHIVDFEKHKLYAGDVMVISKGQIHCFDEYSSYRGYLILFTDTFIHKYIIRSTITQINHLYNYFLKQEKINNPENNLTFINSLKNELENSPVSLPNIIGALLSIYLLKLNNKNIRSTSYVENRSLEYFNQFRHLLETNYSKTRDAKMYASELSISYKHLNEVCKEVVNVTVKSFVDSYVILEAKRMLVTTTLSAKEIAFSLGFDEPTNFLKYFKKHTGLTPVEFRMK